MIMNAMISMGNFLNCQLEMVLQKSKISDCEYENIKKLMQQGTKLIIKQ